MSLHRTPLVFLACLCPAHQVNLEAKDAPPSLPPPFAEIRNSDDHWPAEAFAWGKNDEGQLGLSNGGDVTPATRPTQILFLTRQYIIDLAVGEQFSLGRTERGVVFAWGNNDRGQLGTNSTISTRLPMILSTFGFGAMEVASIATGPDFAFAVTRSGNLYGWGANRRGQLGLGDTIDRDSPELITDNIKLVAAGVGRHVLAISKGDNVYAWGLNDEGQLGMGELQPLPSNGEVPEDGFDYDHTNRLFPSRIALLDGKGVVQVCVGRMHSVALTGGNRSAVWVWGGNSRGQLGIHDGQSRESPAHNTNVDDLHPKQIACGGDFVMVLSENGTVWGWGGNAFGQLGTMDFKDKDRPWPAFMPERIRVKQISAGSGHVLAVSTEGRVFGWGKNSMGQLGLGFMGTASVNRPRDLQMGRIPMLSVVAGQEHSMGITKPFERKASEDAKKTAPNSNLDSLLPFAYRGYMQASVPAELDPTAPGSLAPEQEDS